MKLRSISLQNVRRFTGEVRIDGIGDGLNVLCEPNEHGKSTLFDAVQALFFKPHGSRDREVLALRPHAGGAPKVTIELETPEGRFTVSKRWLTRAEASVAQPRRTERRSPAKWLSSIRNKSGGALPGSSAGSTLP